MLIKSCVTDKCTINCQNGAKMTDDCKCNCTHGLAGPTCDQLSLRSEFTDPQCGTITDQKEGIISLGYFVLIHTTILQFRTYPQSCSKGHILSVVGQGKRTRNDRIWVCRFGFEFGECNDRTELCWQLGRVGFERHRESDSLQQQVPIAHQTPVPLWWRLAYGHPVNQRLVQTRYNFKMLQFNPYL